MQEYLEHMNKKVEWGLDLEIDNRAYSGWVITLVLSIFLGIGLAVVPNFYLVPELNTVSVFAKGSTYGNLAGLTNKVLALTRAYNANPNPSTFLNLQDAVEAREQALSQALETDPISVLAVVFNENALRAMPEKIKEMLEKKIILEGDLAVSHSDDFDNEISTYDFAIIDNNGHVTKLYLTNQAVINQVSGFNPKKVSATGYLIDNKLIVDGESNSVRIISSVQGISSAPVIKKVAIILFNWQNDTAIPISEANARAGMFTSATSTNAYHKENSFNYYQLEGRDQVDGDIYGTYTIPYSSGAGCSVTDMLDWAASANLAAQNAGVDISGYDFKVYVHPKNSSCGFAGAALITSSLGYINLINGSGYYKTWVMGHEVGHLLGANHANFYNCGSVTISTSTNCSPQYYGDPFNIMGNSGLNNHMNGYHKNLIGAYASSNIQTITSSGIYTISPLEPNSSTVQTLAIPRATGGASIYDHIYLDYRQPIGFDSNLSSRPAMINGVTVHVAPCSSPYVNCPTAGSGASSNAGQSLLLDNTPGDGNKNNSALQVGQTFTDPDWGVTVTTLSVNATEATVQVSIAGIPCVRANPTVSISPASQWGNAGQSLNYNVSVTNWDNSGCSASTFAINPNLPSGFTQSPTSLSENLNPGASVTRTISVTSGGSTPEGIYQFMETAINNSATSFQASAVANYNVNLPVADKFNIGDRVVVTTNKLQARPSPGSGNNGFHSLGDQGTVIDGPVLVSGSSWWNINYDTAPDGWSVQDWLELASPTPTPTPTPTPSPTPSPTATPISDSIAPQVNTFDVQPRTTNGAITVSWTFTDSGGSHLNRAEVQVAKYNSRNCNETYKEKCNWSTLTTITSPVGLDSWSSSVSAQQNKGEYWYGIHAVDNAGNRGVEPAQIKVSR